VREWLRDLVGISPLRCGDCGARFVARTWDVSAVTHSRCPKCLRMDLNVWTEEQYWPGAFMKLKIRLGAHPWRCEYCRHNFAGFRPRLEQFSFNRWRERARARETGCRCRRVENRATKCVANAAYAIAWPHQKQIHSFWGSGGIGMTEVS